MRSSSPSGRTMCLRSARARWKSEYSNMSGDRVVVRVSTSRSSRASISTWLSKWPSARATFRAFCGRSTPLMVLARMVVVKVSPGTR